MQLPGRVHSSTRAEVAAGLLALAAQAPIPSMAEASAWLKVENTALMARLSRAKPLEKRIEALQRAIVGRNANADECMADAKRHRDYAALAEAKAQQLREEVQGIQGALSRGPAFPTTTPRRWRRSPSSTVSHFQPGGGMTRN